MIIIKRIFNDKIMYLGYSIYLKNLFIKYIDINKFNFIRINSHFINIEGSRHEFTYYCLIKKILIGCKLKEIERWKNTYHYESKNFCYSKKDVEEYLNYKKFCEEIKNEKLL